MTLGWHADAVAEGHASSATAGDFYLLHVRQADIDL
jgi:hypothetical protein